MAQQWQAQRYDTQVGFVSKLGREVRVDRWQIMRFEPPCFIVLDNGVAPTGRDAKTHPERRAEGVEGCNMNAITPETEDSTHYFWAFARRFLLDDAAMSERLRTEITNVFDQDRVIVEATHKVMKLEPGREVVHLVADRPQNLARALIRQQLTAEAATAPAVVAHYDLRRAADLAGSTLPGTSSGDAIAMLDALAAPPPEGQGVLPPGMEIAWTEIGRAHV